tara:strand:- start:131 stop:622 length:492 start_codon:yes stop_codon:yes gene_type:complete
MAITKLVSDSLGAGVGGKVLQVVTAETSTAVSQTADAFISSGLTASITPSSTSNKILVLTSTQATFQGDGSSSSGRVAFAALFRGTVSDTNLQQQTIGLSDRTASTSSGTKSSMNICFNYLDSPATTSAQTYTVGISGNGATDVIAQLSSGSKSTITLLEVSA